MYAIRSYYGGFARQGQDRHQIGLLVDIPAVVGLPIEMNGQAGDDCDRPFAIDQRAVQVPVRAAPADPAGKREVAIKPGGQQGASVHFHPKLQTSLMQLHRLGLDPQTGAVRMGSGHPEWPALPSISGQREGDQTGIVSNDVISYNFV